MKCFNVQGLCSPEEHYAVDVSKKVAEICELVNQQKYFAINRARQYGKTNMLAKLERTLRPRYYVIKLSFQGVGTAFFEDEKAFLDNFVSNVAQNMKQNSFPRKLISAWNSPLSDLKDLFGNAARKFIGKTPNAPFVILHQKVVDLCTAADKPIVLMIDEVDQVSNNEVFLDFLGMLRENYLKRQNKEEASFQSVILAGVTDIKNLKAKIRPDKEHKLNSPFNIAVDFKVDMSFSTEEIAGMLQEYEADHQTGMNITEMASLLREYTAGYPFLVSKICKLMDEDIGGTIGFPTNASVWTRDGFLAAEKRLLEEENNTLFDDLIKQIQEHSDLDRLLYGMLFEGIIRPFNPQNNIYQLGSMYGLLGKQGTVICVSNRIFQTMLYNYYLDRETLDRDLNQSAQSLKSRFTTHGHLNMDLVLTKFHEHFKSVGLSNSDVKKFVEKNGRKMFLLYLRTIINGTGHYYVEAVMGDDCRTDVIVDYRGEQFVIELKIWHGQQYNAAGEKQLLGYLDYYNLDRGWMLTFDFRKGKQTGAHEIELEGKTILEVVV